MEHRMKKTWIVVADEAIARLLEVDGRVLKPVEELTDPDADIVSAPSVTETDPNVVIVPANAMTSAPSVTVIVPVVVITPEAVKTSAPSVVASDPEMPPLPPVRARMSDI